MRLKFGLVLLAVALSFAAPPKLLVPNAVTDVYRPLPLDTQKLSGLLAERMRANSEGFLEHTDKNLLTSEGGQESSAAAQEQAGYFLNAGSTAYDYTRDGKLRGVIDRIAGQILADIHARGKAQNCELNGSACRHTLLGLLAYYRVTGNEDALAGSRQLADFLISNRLRSPGLIEPMIYLYRRTSENRYLDFAKSSVGNQIVDPAVMRVATAEMLSYLAGEVQLYRVTGDQSYLKRAVATWQEQAANRLSVTGTLSTSSVDEPASDCLTVSWLQLTLELLRVTGDARYADQLEKTVYNQLLAGQDPRTGDLCPAVGISGRKTWSADPAACASEEARGIALIPALVWGRYENGIAVNFYTAGRGTAILRHRRGTIQLYSEATFPETGQISLHVEPDHTIQFPLRLRVPQWVGHFTADIDGSHLVGAPGTYMNISREWKRGDTVKIQMDLPVHTITRNANSTAEIALQRGPQVLALGNRLNPELTDLSAASLPDAAVKPTLGQATNNLPSSWASDQAYSIDGLYRGKQQKLTFIPFADAISYRVWLRKFDVKQAVATY